MKLNKKVALVLGSVLMLSTTTMLKAQEQPWRLGVEAGASLHKLQGLEDKKFDTNDSRPLIGSMIKGGITGGYSFHKYVGVGIELHYAQLGGKVEEKISGGGDKKANKFNITTHNLVVPAMIQLFPMGCDSASGVFAINVGMQLEVPVVSTVKKSTADNADKLEADDDFKKAYLRPVNLSLIGGVSYEIANMGLVVGLRGSLGLMDIFKTNNEAKAYKQARGMDGDRKLTNHSIALSVGYNFANLLL